MNKVIKIDGKKISVEANASTLLIYEDRFKGRRLLKDISELVKITTVSDIPLSFYSKFFWATAKTANETIPDIYEWSKDFSIAEIIKGGQVAFALICKSIETSKKQKATVSQRVISQLTKFFHLPSKAD